MSEVAPWSAFQARIWPPNPSGALAHWPRPARSVASRAPPEGQAARAGDGESPWATSMLRSAPQRRARVRGTEFFRGLRLKAKLEGRRGRKGGSDRSASSVTSPIGPGQHEISPELLWGARRLGYSAHPWPHELESRRAGS